MKKSYISPPLAALDVTIVRDGKEPYCTISLDLGIPNFTIFSLKMPLVVDKPASMMGLLGDGLSALLDEMSAFMLSLEFDEQIIVHIYALALATFKEITPDSSDAGKSEVAQDSTVVTYRGSFPLPLSFVNETHSKVVTGSQVVKRIPKVRRVELSVMKPNKVDTRDVERIIRQYRGRTLKTSPRPLFITVYDMKGRPAGVVPIGTDFKNTLLKKIRGSAAPQFTDPLTFERDAELRYKNAVGIPKSISLGEVVYAPEATCGEDMALYTSGDRYLVKFPDGRVVKFSKRPSVRELKNKNYPVPSEYWRWNLIHKEEPMEQLDSLQEGIESESPELLVVR